MHPGHLDRRMTWGSQCEQKHAVTASTSRRSCTALRRAEDSAGVCQSVPVDMALS